MVALSFTEKVLMFKQKIAINREEGQGLRSFTEERPNEEGKLSEEQICANKHGKVSGNQAKSPFMNLNSVYKYFLVFSG